MSTCCFLVSPQISPFDFDENVVNSNELVSLTCSVKEGDLPLKITWMHNNRTVDNGDGISVMNMNKKISMLSIDSVEAVHAGEYTCVVQNAAGVAKHSAHLKVNG